MYFDAALGDQIQRRGRAGRVAFVNNGRSRRQFALSQSAREGRQSFFGQSGKQRNAPQKICFLTHVISSLLASLR